MPDAVAVAGPFDHERSWPAAPAAPSASARRERRGQGREEVREAVVGWARGEHPCSKRQAAARARPGGGRACCARAGSEAPCADHERDAPRDGQPFGRRLTRLPRMSSRAERARGARCASVEACSSAASGARPPAAARCAVEDPATGETLVEVADAPARGRPGRARRGRRQTGRVGRDRAARARRDPAPRVRGDRRRSSEELALLMTLEMGKALAESRAEIAYAAEFFSWFSEEAVRMHGRYMVNTTGNGRILTMRQPVGPCVFVTPWNFPDGDGHAQDRAGDRRGLHDRRQARPADAAVDARAGEDPRAGRAAGGRAQRDHRRALGRGDRAAAAGPAHAQALLHRLDRGRAHADRTVGRAGAARVDGARRQRAVPGLRGRRPGRGARGRDAREDAQRRRGVHGGQPLPRARVDRRGLRRAGWPSGWAR